MVALLGELAAPSRAPKLLPGSRREDWRAHDVLTVDSASLVAGHEQRITLAPINTGSTIFNPQPRGVGTFLPIADYPYEGWRRRRGRTDAVVELAVVYAVPDIVQHTLLAEARRGEDVLEILWER